MQSLGELVRFEPFNRLSDEARGLLTQGVVRKSMSAGASVMYKGQPASGAYMVLSGRLRVFTVTPSGTEATLYMVDPGETCVLALNCLFNDLLYPAWVEAEAPTSLAIIPGPLFRRLFAKEPAIQDLTVQALSTLVYRLMAELNDIHSSNHKQRLVRFLLMHASSEGLLETTQQQLANHLGTTREVVARLMQDLVAGGFVKTQRGRITIKDLFGLRRLEAGQLAAPSSVRKAKAPRR
ncbi:Crp/Fnr family transcriptional regulator [Polaromonas sp. A23]|uniref:Crp/Fnr family transcriptional regulator n=1 Tax=Polaromonas sp. A23 TaxID=1944133 RepID=UPI000987572C|nr:Crp/Fnr family transcriptional regulator [Polaromonas sp. A23]OOG43046.1 cAMP-binding protein [Polaromonas sp. A23]